MLRQHYQKNGLGFLQSLSTPEHGLKHGQRLFFFLWCLWAKHGATRPTFRLLNLGFDLLRAFNRGPDVPFPHFPRCEPRNYLVGQEERLAEEDTSPEVAPASAVE